MKITYYIFFALTLNYTAYATELPSRIRENLESVKQQLILYSEKSPEQIFDHKYDDSEAQIIFSLDAVEILGYVYKQDVMKEFRFEMIKNIAEVYSHEQLISLTSMSKEWLLLMRGDSSGAHPVYFSTALEWKEEAIDKTKAMKKLVTKPFSFRESSK